MLEVSIVCLGLRALDSCITGLVPRSALGLEGNLSSFRLMFRNREIHDDVLKTILQDCGCPEISFLTFSINK